MRSESHQPAYCESSSLEAIRAGGSVTRSTFSNNNSRKGEKSGTATTVKTAVRMLQTMAKATRAR